MRKECKMKTVRILALVLMLALTVAACGSAGTMSPEELVQAYIEAQNNQDVETALALIAEDAVFDVPEGLYQGKDEAKEWVEQAFAYGATVAARDFQTEGNRTVYICEVDVGSTVLVGQWELVAGNGKLKEFRLLHWGE
jgi:hypothetical protein